MSEVDPFEHVARVIQLSEGFCLIMLVGRAEDERAGLRRVQRALGAGYTVRWHDVGRDGPDLRPSVAMGVGGRRLVLFVYGIDEGDDARWLRMAERLNMGRDALSSMSIAVVLWIPRETAEPFIAASPDLFALRSHLETFDEDDLIHSVTHPAVDPDAIEAIDALVQRMQDQAEGDEDPTPPADTPAARVERLASSPPQTGGRLRRGDLLEGRYVIGERIAAGPFAYVFKAVDIGARGRLLAIKVLHPSVRHDEAHRRWLFAQAEMMQRVGPTVFPPVVVARGEAADCAFIATAYVRHAERWFIDADAFDLLVELGRAVGRLHAAGLIHGRVCPGNVLVEADERHVSLVDPTPPGDIVCAEPDGQQHIDGPAYVAPEVTLGGRPLGPTADIFSLGMLGALILHGRPLPARAGWQPAAFIGEIASSQPALRDVLRRATAIDPADRYDSVAAFTDALTEARRIR